MKTDPILVPVPRRMTLTDAMLTLPPQGQIAIGTGDLRFEGEWIQRVLADCGFDYAIVLQSAHALVQMRIDSDQPPQGYSLRIDTDGLRIVGGDAAGVFYGLTTLRQLLLNDPLQLPGLYIEDQPDYAARGFMLDISRDRVPTLETLFLLVDDLAVLKMNQLQLYMEHTFAYADHELVWRHASPLTPEDILRLDAYCRQRHVELVPNQNSLGHKERWLMHPAYRHLAESPDGFEDMNGRWRGPSTLAPLEPGSLSLMTSLYDDLLPHFTSTQFNVGCDEPWELGRGRSREAIEREGGRIYLGWLLKLHQAVRQRGRQMMFWGDIILKYPDLVPELPPDVIVMEWGYEATHPFDANCQHYAAAGIPFYVCPGTSSWNSLTGRADNVIGNIRAAAEAGLKHGAAGLLVTDWGDNGHWQPYPVSYIGMAYAAGVSWNYAVNHALEIPPVLDTLIYRDEAHLMGRVTLALANLYQRIGPDHVNGQVLAYALQWPADEIEADLKRLEQWGGTPANSTPDAVQQVISTAEELAAELDQARMQRDDAALIRREWQQAARLLAHGGRWLLFAPQPDADQARRLLDELETLIVQQRQNWLARSRPGGLEDSMRRFEHLRRAYLAASD